MIHNGMAPFKLLQDGFNLSLRHPRVAVDQLFKIGVGELMIPSDEKHKWYSFSWFILRDMKPY